MICQICNTEYFNRGYCSKKVTCQDLKLIYNNGKSFFPKLLTSKQRGTNK
ncbi:hypothetical protein LCGC14_2686290 [marine sediment metagenome]|uniref:Uncharacterized protein n=1 Tax=marine sediment metagenome TaxID=412755 RepID=A0A0F8ZJW6_9ZZZZ